MGVAVQECHRTIGDESFDFRSVLIRKEEGLAFSHRVFQRTLEANFNTNQPVDSHMGGYFTAPNH